MYIIPNWSLVASLPFPCYGDRMETIVVTKGHRGRADHALRDQIISAANDHFSHFGYGKTTVNDLAKSIGISKGYIYKFFESKQAIGEAICVHYLAKVAEAGQHAIDEGGSASEKLKRFFMALIQKNTELFFDEKRLYDIAAYSTAEKWPSSQAHLATLSTMLKAIIVEGRESGEFERKTPLDELCRVILLVMQPFLNAMMLEQNLDLVAEAPGEIANLVLRSLTP